MRLISFAIAALISAFAAGHAFAQSNDSGSGARVALIVGNASYPDSEAPLKEPINDVRGMAEQLKRDGFDVDVGENLSKEATQRALRRFYGKIGSNSTALIFFSGYGIQSSRQTYMIPVDGQIWTEAEVQRDGVSLDSVLAEMNTRGARVKIAILDASRRNPFERRFRSFSAGLAPVLAPTGTLVMYSAAPSTVVNESANDRGLFVSELLKELRAPGLAGEEVFNRTRMGVSRASQGQQVPWFSSSLSEEFSFGNSPRPSVASTSTSTTTSTSNAPTISSPEPRPLLPPAITSIVPKTDPAPSTSTPSPTRPPPVANVPVNDPEIRDLTTRIQNNPSDGSAYYKRGQVYAKNGDYPGAIRDFTEAIRLNPKDAEALNNRCWTRALANELQAALKDCNEALQVRPRFADALDSRGFVNLKLGLPASAIADYDAVLQVAPKQASSLYGRGVAKLRTDNRTGGNSDIAAAKAIDPRIADEFAGYGVR